jgi:16S rRNA (cytosine1402-N4)-methyltransferase
LLDLGVSSPQLDNPERGFSFRADGPLDMRMDRSQPLTAADLVNQRSERDLADLFYRLGDENRSRAIARAVARRREKQPIRTTMELAEVVAAAVGRRTPGGLHPATKVFQALRIAVNHELDALAATLPMAARLIIPGGRLAVISFHSGEDRITKEFFRKHASLWLDTPEHPQSFRNPECLFQPARRFLPSAAEIEKNPRARSARLRVACRNDNPSRTSNPNPKLHRP